MRKSRIVIGIFLAAVLAMPVCAGGKSDKTDAAAGQKTKVVFWTWLPREDQWDFLYKEFQAENPDIEVEFWRTAELTDYLKKLQVGITSDTGPDVFGLQPGSLVNQYQRFCEPMDALANQYMPGWKSIVSASAVEQSTSLEGVVAGMPILLTGQQFMLYNDSLMRECGVTAVPKTYAELLAASKKISAAGKTTMVMGAADIWHDVDWFVWASQQFAPGRIFEAEQGKAAWTDKAFVDTMNAWVKFFTDNVFEKGALGVGTYPDARDQYFFAREAVFFPTGAWHAGAVSHDNEEIQGTAVQKDIIGMASFPQVGPGAVVATTGVDFLLSVNKESKVKQAAAKLVEFFATGKGQQLWTDTLQGSPVANNVTFGGKLNGEIAQSSIDSMNKLLAASGAKRKLDYPEIETALGVAMQEAATGRPVLDVLKDVQSVSDRVERN